MASSMPSPAWQTGERPEASSHVCDRQWRWPRRSQQDVSGSGRSLLGERRSVGPVVRPGRASSACRPVSAGPTQRVRIGASVCSQHLQVHLVRGHELEVTSEATWRPLQPLNGVQHRRSLCVQNATQAQSIRSNGGLRCQSATDGPEHQNERKAAPRLANSPESASPIIRSKSQIIRSSTAGSRP